MTLCGQIVCQPKPLNGIEFRGGTTLHFELMSENRCRLSGFCVNKIDGVNIDEYGCEDDDLDFKCLPVLPSEPTFAIGSARVCDKVCDCNFCEDEARCHNLTVGVFCKSALRGLLEYVRPYLICDNIADCLSRIDEEGCDDYNDTCWTYNAGDQTDLRVLTSRGGL